MIEQPLTPLPHMSYQNETEGRLHRPGSPEALGDHGGQIPHFVHFVFEVPSSCPTGLPFLPNSNETKGASINDVCNIFRFFSPPYCHKSADVVPFVCFLGTPTPTADILYGSPPSRIEQIVEQPN